MSDFKPKLGRFVLVRASAAAFLVAISLPPALWILQAHLAVSALLLIGLASGAAVFVIAAAWASETVQKLRVLGVGVMPNQIVLELRGKSAMTIPLTNVRTAHVGAMVLRSDISLNTTDGIYEIASTGFSRAEFGNLIAELCSVLDEHCEHFLWIPSYRDLIRELIVVSVGFAGVALLVAASFFVGGWVSSIFRSLHEFVATLIGGAFVVGLVGLIAVPWVLRDRWKYRGFDFEQATSACLVTAGLLRERFAKSDTDVEEICGFMTRNYPNFAVLFSSRAALSKAKESGLTDQIRQTARRLVLEEGRFGRHRQRFDADVGVSFHWDKWLWHETKASMTGSIEQ